MSKGIADMSQSLFELGGATESKSNDAQTVTLNGKPAFLLSPKTRW